MRSMRPLRPDRAHLLCTLLSLLVLFGTLGAAPAPPRLQASGGAVTLSATSSTVPAGGSTTVTLTAAAPTASNLGTWLVEVSYDPAKATVTCSGASGSLCNAGFSSGLVRVNGDSLPGLTGTVTLATLTVTLGGSVAGNTAVPLTITRASITDDEGAAHTGVTTTPATITSTGQAASALAFTTQPGGGVAGSAWAVQPVITLQAGGATATGSTASVLLTVSSGPGTLSCFANPVSAAAGVATFSGCSASAAGTYTVTASSGGVPSIDSGSFTVTAAVATGGGGGGGGGGGAPPPAATPAPTSGPTQTTLTPTLGGTVTSGDSSISLSIPAGSLNVGGGSGGDVTVGLGGVSLSSSGTTTVQAVAETLPVPEGHVFGSTAFKFTLTSKDGGAVSLASPVTMRVKYTKDDLAKAGDGGAIKLAVYSAGSKTWQAFPTELSSLTGVASAQVQATGLFALIIALPTPTLTAPAAGMVSTDFAPRLAWNVPSGATQVHLQVIPANNDGPGVDLILDVATEYQMAAPKLGVGNYVLLPGITYTWRVRTTSVATALGAGDAGWSAWVAGSFKTADASARSIAAASPANGGTVDTLRPTLRWQDSNDKVFYYEVQVSKEPGFGADAFLYDELRHGGVTTPANSYTIPTAFPLEPATTYAWRVRPRIQGDGTPAPWAEAFTFRTP